MTTAQICIILAIGIYLLAMIGVGLFFNRTGGSSSDDFYLGGRSLGPVVTAMSAEASDMSSYLLMGLPGLAYLCGVAEVGWTVIGLAAGTYLNWLIVARRLRCYSAAAGAITIPDFFSRRYGDKRHILACIAAIIILIFFVPYTASGFKAVGTLFNSLLGVDYHAAMIAGALVIIGYTVLGGFLAVSTTDLVQSIVMTIALAVIIIFGIREAGGWDAVMANVQALPGYLNLTQGYDAASGTASSFGFLSIVSTLAWGLGYFGMPHILLRFMAIEDGEKLKISRRIASVWVVISMFVAILIGVGGYGVSVTGKIPFLT
ncbi:MAG: sodium:proline symporter, partial [Oscillospiraceae bacterium]|nr:sodium:proline symporter [Oscillospiraceae bacterium]